MIITNISVCLSYKQKLICTHTNGGTIQALVEPPEDIYYPAFGESPVWFVIKQM